MKTGGLVNVKSYLTMECNGEKRAVYRISAVEDNSASFEFTIPDNAQNVRWHMITDFSMQIRNFKIFDAEDVCNDKYYMSDDGRGVIADVPVNGSTITVQCDVYALTYQQREDLLRREYGRYKRS